MAGGTQRKTVVAGNGVLFEVVFKNADPRKKPAHGISLSYGGQVYRCSDAASIGSVHTIHTDDEDDDEDDCLRNSRGHGKVDSQASPRKAPVSSACLKKSPRGSILRSPLSPKPSPKKLRRSRTLSPSHQSRTRSILAPFSNFSRKLSFRRHSYDEDTKTKQDKRQVRQEATKPVIGRRPIVQSIPFGCQQAPPHFAYQNQFPMYHYVPAPHPQPVFGAPPTAYPMAHGAPSNNTAPQCPPALQQLQDHINHLTSILAANPINLLAKRELGRLLAERNSFLDSATKKTATTANPSRVETVKPKKDGVRFIATKEPTVDDLDGNELQENAAASSASSQLSVAPEQHHICSGCSERRSPSFHRKHPFTKPVHNVCRKCREGKRASSVMNRYHFCDSCGIVRSKEYHHRRGNATSASGRSRICRKCHLDGNHVRESTSKAPRDYKDPSKDEKRKEVTASKPVARTASALPRESVKIEPRARVRQSQRQRDSANDTGVLSYDGTSDFGQSSRSTTQPETLYDIVKEEAFNSYRPPEISDEDVSSNQPVTLESSFHSSGTEPSNFQERTAPAAHCSEFPLFDSACESSSASLPSLRASSHNTTGNPYYQPRSTAARPCSPSRSAEAPLPPLPPPPPPRRPSPPTQHLPFQASHPPSTKTCSGSAFPDFPDVSGKPRFVDRNQSWPGDMHVPFPSDFSYVSGTGRRVSASDGAHSPQPSPPADDSHRPWTRADAGERFTTGAFGKPPPASSFQTSTSPPASPWASFSGPIPHPTADEPSGGSRGAFSYDGSSHAGARKASVFGGCYYRSSSPEPPASPDDPPRGFPFRFEKPRSYSRRGGSRDEFKSTRGAWNVSTGSSAFARRGGHEDVPEPIIEEPSSPVAKSPLTTPLLLEFHGETSDSGVEFLTDSADSFSASSSSSSSSSSQESLLASHLGGLSVHNF